MKRIRHAARGTTLNSATPFMPETVGCRRIAGLYLYEVLFSS
jgi:hypothetical protein